MMMSGSSSQNAVLFPVANTDKAIAIAVKGLVQEPGIEGVSSEYNYEEGQIKALQA